MKPPRLTPSVAVEEFLFLRSILGAEMAICRLAQAYQSRPESVCRQLNRGGLLLSEVSYG